MPFKSMATLLSSVMYAKITLLSVKSFLTLFSLNNHIVRMHPEASKSVSTVDGGVESAKQKPIVLQGKNH